MIDAQQYYTGNYLHRLYLAKNALFGSIHSSNDLSQANQALKEAVEELRIKEDQALIGISKLRGTTGSAAEGEQILNQLFRGSNEALQVLIDIVGQYMEKGTQFDFNDEKNRVILVEAIIDYINQQRDNKKSTVSANLSKQYEKIYDNLISKLNALVFDSGKNIRSAYAFEGYVHEELVNSIFQYNVLQELSTKSQSDLAGFEEWVADVAAISSSTGNESWSVRGGQIKTGKRNSSYDMVIHIPIDDYVGDVPIQLKAKPKSRKPEIQLVNKMEIDNLLSDSGMGYAKTVIKTAIINQHFWGTSAYKQLVTATGQALNYTPDANLSSAHPTALERFDESQTLDTLKPVIPILENALFYKLITGIHEKIDTLFYVVTSTSGYQLMRSSDLIQNMMGLGKKYGTTKRTVGKVKGLENIKSSGRVRINGSPIVNMSGISELYGEPGRGALPREEWYNQTQNKADDVYSKAAITLTYNYSGIK